MKKIVSLVVTAALILSQSSITKVYADDAAKEENKSVQTNSPSSKLLEEYKAESELFGTTYEEVNRPVPRYISSNKDEREEFSLDRDGLSSITSLTPLTNAKYEVVLSYADKNTYVSSADTLQIAIVKAQGLINSDPNATPAVLETQSKQIVYATEALGRVVKMVNGVVYPGSDKTSNVYSNSFLSSGYTYVNDKYIDDVPILEDNGTSAKVEVSGYTGWMNKDISKSEYDLMVVPLSRAANPSYYISESGELKHYISFDVLNKSGNIYGVKLGPAPSFMQAGVKYYSYDGNYFYRDLKTLISDGKAGHHNNAVNSGKAYYNYYQYLPFRSKSSFTGDQINNYLENYASLKDNSKLRGIGQALINGQNSNGVNALITFGVACNESGLGTSSIAQAKNNLFGINAVDSNPAGSANAFATVDDCINDFTKNYFSRDYGDPDDWKHYGAYLGNKNLGANVQYASDPFWGEKAAQFMYKLDYHTSNFVVTSAGSNASINNLKDFNNYQLGIYSKPSDVLSSPNYRSEKLYSVLDSVKTGYGKLGSVFVVKNIEPYRDGNTSYYKITPERSTVCWNDGGRFDGTFDWSKEGYIKSDNVTFINSGKITNELKSGWFFEDASWYYYDPSTGAKSTGWIYANNNWYFLDSTGAMLTDWVNDNGKWYYLEPNGAMKTGWLYYGDSWYYLQGNGIMKTGWLNDGGAWYYLEDSGIMKTGWLNDGGAWYYLQNSGIMKTGWLNWGGTWYYLQGSGIMKTGWLNDGGKWYYLHRGGEMATGWVLVDGKWYYLYGSGIMAYNTTIDGYKLSSSGAML